MNDILCACCGRNAIAVVNPDGTGLCANCYQYCNTCRLCASSVYCAFEQDPSPLPKQVMQTIHQGNAVMQRPIMNPERVKALCPSCSCYDMELGCLRQYGTCGGYKEVAFGQEC